MAITTSNSISVNAREDFIIGIDPPGWRVRKGKLDLKVND
jgi:hypothetical protein